MRITRNEALDLTNTDLVLRVESMSVDFTNRVTDGTYRQGWTEFSAFVACKDQDGDKATLSMYVYIDTAILADNELDYIDWDAAINEAEYELV